MILSCHLLCPAFLVSSRWSRTLELALVEITTAPSRLLTSIRSSHSMASVTSLDKDLRKMRLSKYNPQAASEVRTWIEDVLQEPLAAGDLLNALKDGIALCKYEDSARGIFLV